jgi:hypothetical protein
MNLSFLLLGIDSLIAGIAISPLVSARARVPLAVLFGVADGIGFLVGAMLGWHLPDEVTDLLPSVALLAYGLYLILVSAASKRVAARWPMWVLPWALTVDNLSYGLVHGRGVGEMFQQAGLQAVSSALLAGIGLAVALVLPRAKAAGSRGFVGAAGGALVLASAALMLVG